MEEDGNKGMGKAQALSVAAKQACETIIAMKKSGLVAALPSTPERRIEFASNLLKFLVEHQGIYDLVGIEEDLLVRSREVVARLESAVCILPKRLQVYDWGLIEQIGKLTGVNMLAVGIRIAAAPLATLVVWAVMNDVFVLQGALNPAGAFVVGFVLGPLWWACVKASSKVAINLFAQHAKRT